MSITLFAIFSLACYKIFMITSKDNQIFKQLKLLKQNKQYLFLDNPKLIEEAICAGFTLEYLIVNANKKSNLTFNAKNIVEFNESLFNVFTSTCNSQGLLGVIENKTKALKPPENNFLILDNLQDPGNVGTILRTALGANFKDVYLVDCVNVLNDKLVRSSMGAIFKLNVYECEKNDFLNFAKSNFHSDIYVADMNGESVFEVTPKASFGIVLGNEGNGVSKEMFSISTKTIKIPMQNNLESLNVAVAGSILMYELNKKNF